MTGSVDTGSSYRLAVSAEMVFVDLPFEERVRRIADAGFEVEIWDWTKKDVAALAKLGATFSSMTGYITGTLIDVSGGKLATQIPRLPWEAAAAAGTVTLD